RHTRFSRDWSSDVCSSDLNLDRCTEPFPDKPQGGRAFYPLVNQLKQNRVVDFIKEPLEVNVHYVLIAIVDVFQGLCYGLMDVLLRAEAIAVFLEREFVFDHQHLAYRLLQPPFHYCGNPQ